VPNHVVLPQDTHNFLDGSATEKTISTFIGKADLGEYTKDEFDVIRARTGQMVVGDLVMPGYGQIDATITYGTKDSILRNYILGMFTTYLKDELCEALCPGIT